MSDFNALVQYTVENISRPVKYIIYKLTEFIRVVDKFVFRTVPAGAASGYANIEKVEGNTVKFNQKINIVENRSSLLGFTFTRLSNTKVRFVGTGNTGDTYLSNTFTNSVISGHKYLFSTSTTGATTSNITFHIGTKYTTIRNNSKWIQTGGSWTFYLCINCVSAFSESTTFEIECNAIDLTATFGAGNEPSTVADFEAWRDQNGLPAYADYNAGELLSCKMSGMQTEDSSQQTLDTLPFDVTTYTGINTSTNVREVMFSSGMKQADYAGTVKDEIDLGSDTATVNVGSRAYQSGDESDTDVLTDGTTTFYALTTPIEYTDLQDANGNPIKGRYAVEQGGTEQVLPVNTSTPTTVAPTLTTTYTKDNN